MSQNSIHAAAAKSREKQRVNSLKILHFDSRDEEKVNQAFQEVVAFSHGFNFPRNLSSIDIMVALTAAQQASDEYFTSRHTAAWDTTFVIPPQA